MVVETLPVMSIPGVAPDVQGASLFCRAIGWAGLVACIASKGRWCWSSRTAVLSAAVLAATYAANLPLHVLLWRRAGEFRDRIERAVVTNSMMVTAGRFALSVFPTISMARTFCGMAPRKRSAATSARNGRLWRQPSARLRGIEVATVPFRRPAESGPLASPVRAAEIGCHSQCRSAAAGICLPSLPKRPASARFSVPSFARIEGAPPPLGESRCL